MKTISIHDININSCEVILDKSGRVVDGVNHGRKILYDKDKNLYYKIFDKEYCRRKNFVNAYEKGFFDELAPALSSLIVSSIVSLFLFNRSISLLKESIIFSRKFNLCSDSNNFLL